jgi:hypothetical protein
MRKLDNKRRWQAVTFSEEGNDNVKIKMEYITIKVYTKFFSE